MFSLYVAIHNSFLLANINITKYHFTKLCDIYCGPRTGEYHFIPDFPQHLDRIWSNLPSTKYTSIYHAFQTMVWQSYSGILI